MCLDAEGNRKMIRTESKAVLEGNNPFSHNKVSTKSGLNTICRLNPLVIFPVKVRNSFNTGVLLYGRKVHAAYKMVEEHLRIFNLP